MQHESQKAAAGSAILTVKDVAEYLRMSEAKVYRLAREGQLPVTRIGKTWRFRKDLLDAWLEKSSQHDGAPPHE